MNILILGAAGFIGTNLSIFLLEQGYNVTLVDKEKDFFSNDVLKYSKANIVEFDFGLDADFDSLIKGTDIIFHLVSTTVPTTSNRHISDELMSNVIVTTKLLESCVNNSVKKVVFLSSGGTVYGTDVVCPIKEENPTNPITAYGIQKLMIEKLLYLYRTMYGLDYKVVRLANPYGPHQKPNGILGAVTTFTYKALNRSEIEVYGDGSVVRDFIYIDDAVKAIVNIAFDESSEHTFNVGSGEGTSIKQLIKDISKSLELDMRVTYKQKRKIDVPVNFLDVTKYEIRYGLVKKTTLEQGIIKTADYLRSLNRKV